MRPPHHCVAARTYLCPQHFSTQDVLLTMKRLVYLFLLSISFAACTNKSKGPDVSNIQVDLAVKRFDQDFFSMDTSSLLIDIGTLEAKYPKFTDLFFQNIIGVNNPEGVTAFYRLHKPLFDSSQLIYKDFTPIQKQLEEALRHVKYYFPAYEIPASVIPIIGPMNSREDLARMANGEFTPNFIGPDFVGISLQFYLGKDFSFYNSEYFIDNIAPLYRSRRFSKEYIAADVMKLITDDMFPDKSATLSLIEQMIEKGKQWWLLDKFMPQAPDSVKIGYTQQQLNWVNANEGLVWSYILKNEPDLYTVNPATLQTYIGEAPFTNVFSQEESPGNIGPWIGWQIIKKFVENNPDMKPEEVMRTAPKNILEEAKYKPK